MDFMGEVFVNNLTRWRNAAMKIVGYQDADDVVQESYLELVKTVGSRDWRLPDNPAAYVHGLVKNVAKMHIRKASHKNEKPHEMRETDGLDFGWLGTPTEQDPETVYMANNILDDAVRAGVITHREWTVMFHLTFEGFTHEELAEVMEVSRVRVTQLANKARKKLEAHYGSS